MVQRILDTNRLIRAWRESPPGTVKQARRLARDLIHAHSSDAIVTPVAIEFLGGTRDKDELAQARAFLAEFRIVDAGRILAQDFVNARALAERIPFVFRARTFADCLIRALADRLHFDLDTADAGVPRSLPPAAIRTTKPRRRAQRRKGP